MLISAVLIDRSAPLNKIAVRAKYRKIFKRLPLLNQCIDFKIIIQECSLGDYVPELLKSFRSVEQNARQVYKKKKSFIQLPLLTR